MRRKIFEPEHDDFRATARSFFLTECVPHSDEWEERGYVDRDVWLKAGELGLIGWEMPEEFGGADIQDFRFNAILNGLGVQNDILSGYFRDLTTEEQKKRWLPKYVSGEYITAIAMSEPGAGSDLANVKTSARRDGDHYVINGAKTFISNGLLAFLVVVACRTDPDAEKPHKGISLIVVETGMEGFTRGRKLDKIGQKSADTAELFFDNVRVPSKDVLKGEGEGFAIAQARLGPGRIHHCMRAIGMAERALELLCRRAVSRTTFGAPLADRSNIQDWIAEARIEIEMVRLLTLKAAYMMDTVGNKKAATEIAAIKVAAPNTALKIVDRAIQVFGGMGVTDDVPLATFYAHLRTLRLADGPDEVHKRAIARRELRPYVKAQAETVPGVSDDVLSARF